MYKVINLFKEKHHANHIYKPGNIYPAAGQKLDAKRAEFLTQKHAEYGVAFLEKFEEKPAPKTAAKTAPKNATAEKPVVEADEKGDA